MVPRADRLSFPPSRTYETAALPLSYVGAEGRIGDDPGDARCPRPAPRVAPAALISPPGAFNPRLRCLRGSTTAAWWAGVDRWATKVGADSLTGRARTMSVSASQPVNADHAPGGPAPR